jgi:agmatinase
LVYLPVPWEATTSYGAGASNGPSAILQASMQVDLFDFDVLKPYEPGLYMAPESKQLRAWNKEGVAAARKKIPDIKRVNALSSKVNDWVHAETSRLMKAGKIVGLIGGDHSTPYGAIKAAAQRHPGLGLLHFDAHHDMRPAYEGFTHSHASIIYNLLRDIPEISKVVQVGIRDFSEQEVEFCAEQGSRVKAYYDGDLSRRKFSGQAWTYLCNEIVEHLPDEVWITFDIDGLDPRFCPNTGTPVPGGLDFREANYLIGTVVRSGRSILGFDLNEVAPDPSGKSEWDANVGARLLYKLTGWTLASHELVKIR